MRIGAWNIDRIRRYVWCVQNEIMSLVTLLVGSCFSETEKVLLSFAITIILFQLFVRSFLPFAILYTPVKNWETLQKCNFYSLAQPPLSIFRYFGNLSVIHSLTHKPFCPLSDQETFNFIVSTLLEIIS